VLTDALSRLLGMVCVSGSVSFIACFTAVFFRLWIDGMARRAADVADE
jgi:hypothetical protein